MKISITGKVSDCFNMQVVGTDQEYDGYVPDCGLGGGDYIEFVVDNETGQILNWKPINPEVFSKD